MIGKVTEEFAAGMLQARAKEGDQFLSCKAVKVISQEKAAAILAEGAECIPLQWIGSDKNDHLRRPGGPEVDPLHKAGRDARGDFEKVYSRTDSPTADQEVLFVVCNYILF